MLTSSLRKVIVIVAAVYAALVVLMLPFIGEPGWEGAIIALRFAIILEVLLAGIAGVAWRWIWRLVPLLNQWV